MGRMWRVRIGVCLGRRVLPREMRTHQLAQRFTSRRLSLRWTGGLEELLGATRERRALGFKLPTKLANLIVA